MDTLDSYHELFMYTHFIDFTVHQCKKPLLIENGLTKCHTRIRCFFSDCKDWISQHLNESMLNLLLKCVFAHKTSHFRYKIEYSKSDTPCLFTCEIYDSWDQFFDQQDLADCLEKWFKIIYERNNDLCCFVLQKD